MRRSRELDAFLRVVAAGNETGVRQASDWVKYEMPSALTYEEARSDLEMWNRISTVVHHFEMVGVIVQHELLSEDLVFDQMGAWIAGTWGKLEAIVLSHRAAPHSPEYCENFELLVALANHWAATHPAKLEHRPRANKEVARVYHHHVIPKKPPKT